MTHQAWTDCLLWISVCYLLKMGPRCSRDQLCSDTVFIRNHCSAHWSRPSCRRPPGRWQNVTHPGYFSNPVKEHTTALVHSLSTVTRTDWEKKLCVWVRNAVKIAAVLSASSHEKESCCLEAWVSVRSVWRICFVMPRETCHSPELNPTGWSPVMQLQDVFFMLIEILRAQRFQMMVKVEAGRLFGGSGNSCSDVPKTLLLRCLRLASDNHPGLA